MNFQVSFAWRVVSIRPEAGIYSQCAFCERQISRKENRKRVEAEASGAYLIFRICDACAERNDVVKDRTFTKRLSPAADRVIKIQARA